MTQIIEFFKFDESEYTRRTTDVELEYEINKPDLSESFNRYKEFFSDYFPEGTDYRRLPGMFESFYLESGPDSAVARIVELTQQGFGTVSGFNMIHNPQAGYYVRWWQEKPAKTIKAEKVMLRELVRQRYQSDLDAMNKAEEERQIGLLVQAAERKRQQEEEARIQAIREQARADLAAAYSTGAAA